MNIISRYILREIISVFIVVAAAFCTVLVTVRMLKFTALIMNKGVEPSQLGMVLLSIFPPFLELALPLSGLLATLIAVSRLSSDSELIVLRSSGISLFKLIIPVAVFAGILTIASIYVSLSLRPWGNKLLQQTLYEIARTRSISGLDQGVFTKLGPLTIYADSVDYATGQLNKVILEDRRAADAPKVIHAQDGRLLSDDGSRTIAFLLRDGSIHEFLEGAYVLTDFTENQLQIHADEVFNSDEARRGQQITEMSHSQLANGANELAAREASQDITSETRPPSEIEIRANWSLTSMNEIVKRKNRLLLELYRRYFAPLASLVLPFLGLALGISAPRGQKSWTITSSVGLGLLLFAVQFGAQSITSALAESGSLPPCISYLFPPVLTGVITAWFIHLVGTERCHAIVEYLIESIQKVRRTA